MVGVWYRRQLHDTREASNGGSCMTMYLEMAMETKYYVHAPRGIDWYEKTIARPRLPLIRKTINK